MKAAIINSLMLMVLCCQLGVQPVNAATPQDGSSYLHEVRTTGGTALWFDKSAKFCKVILEGNEVATFQVVFGVNHIGDKEKQGDYKTPVGIF
jgi:murein L,D-transpeptidase YafK